MVIVDIEPTLAANLTDQLQFNLSTPADYFRYRACRRSFFIAPLMLEDGEVIREMQRLHYANEIRHAADGPIVSTEVPTDSLQALTKKRPSAESAGDGQGNTSNDLIDTNAGKCKTFRHKLFSFHVFLPTYYQISTTVKQLADRLGVDASYLVLFFTAYDKSIAMGRQYGRDSVPISIGHPIKRDNADINKAINTIEDILLLCPPKVAATARAGQKKFYIFFKIAPFPLVEKDTKRFLDIKLTDNRLRYWRQFYISHLRSLQAAVELQSVSISSGSSSAKEQSNGDTLAEAARNLQDSPSSLIHSAPKKRRKQANSIDSPSPQISSSFPPTKLPPVWPPLTPQTTAHMPILMEYRTTQNNIYVSFEKRGRIGDLLEVIRQVLAIPLNINELLASSSGTDDGEVALENQQLLLRQSDEVSRALTEACEGKGAVVSDKIKILYHKAIKSDADSGFQGEEEEEIEEAVSSNKSSSGNSTFLLEVLPHYPLLIYCVRNFMVDEIAAANELVDSLVHTW